MKKFFAVAVILTITFSACGGGDKPSSSSATFSSVGNGTSFMPGKTLDTSLLGGTWASQCELGKDEGRKTGGSHLEYYTFYSDGVGLYSTNFSDKDCKKPALSIFAFVAGAATQNVANESLFTADYAANSDTNTNYTPQSDAMVANFNHERACGHADWVLNQPMAVDGTSCALKSPDGGAATHVTFTLSADHQALTFASCNTSGGKVGSCDSVIDLFRQ